METDKKVVELIKSLGLHKPNEELRIMKKIESERLSRLIKKATTPNRWKSKTFEMGTEAWTEWEETNDNHDVRAKAIEEIKQLSLVEIDYVVANFCRILHRSHYSDSTPGEAIGVIDAMGMLGDARFIKPLIRELIYNERVNEFAANALAEIGTPAVEPLLQLLTEDFNSSYQELIIYTLGCIGDRRALTPLRLILEFSKKNYKDDPSLYYTTYEALSGVDRRPRTLLEKLMMRRKWVKKEKKL